MFNLTKTIKYCAINFNSELKHIVTYHLKWIDSTYDVTVIDKLAKLDGTVIRETVNTQERVNFVWFEKFLNDLKDLDKGRGYYVDIKGVA